MSCLRPILLLAMLAPLCASAQLMRVCTDTRPHPPLLMPDGGGSLGVLVTAAAREAGFSPQYFAMPLSRCKAEVAANTMHAFPLTPFVRELEQFAQYPQRKGMVDPARASTRLRNMVFRRHGEPMDWDGKNFTGLKKPVLGIANGYIVRAKLESLKVPLDDSGQSLKANFDKLLGKRGDVAIGFESEGALLMADPAYVGMVEMLPLPFFEQDYYMVVSKPFYKRHRQKVEAMWDALARLRAAPKGNQARPPKRS